jgi:transcriptional regulator with XRE-family HTH domain
MRALARIAGVSSGSICRIEHGYQYASDQLAAKISQATDGAVTVEALQIRAAGPRVYFLQCLPAGPIKIGVVFADLRQRITEIQVNCPFPLKLLGTVPGDKTEELRIQRLLAEWNKRGEWFEPHPRCLSIIAKIIGGRSSAEGGSMIIALTIEPTLRAVS